MQQRTNRLDGNAVLGRNVQLGEPTSTSAITLATTESSTAPEYSYVVDTHSGLAVDSSTISNDAALRVDPLYGFTGFPANLTHFLKAKQENGSIDSAVLDRKSLIKKLVEYGCVDQNRKCLRLDRLVKGLEQQTRLPREQVADFCSRICDRFDIPHVSIAVQSQEDFSLFDALPSAPQTMYVDVHDQRVLAKSGMESEFATTLAGALNNVTVLQAFHLQMSSGIQEGILAAKPLVEALRSAENLIGLSLSRCDISGVAEMGGFEKLEYFSARHGKGSPEDLAPFRRTKTMRLVGFDLGEERLVFGSYFSRIKLANRFTEVLTHEKSRISQLYLPPLLLDTSATIVQNLGEKNISLDALEPDVVDRSGNRETGHHKQVLRIRETCFPNLPSPHNGFLEKASRAWNGTA